MPHMDWCGKPCDECENPCALDESIPCSLNCENLFPDGSRDITKCFHAGCDAVEYRECGFCDAVKDICGEDENQTSLWTCEKCDKHFCEPCFSGDLGERNLLEMVGAEKDAHILCPECFRKKFRISKHFKANSVYQDSSGQQYTMFFKPKVHGYHTLRLQSNGDIISNSGFVFHSWMREFKYVGPRPPVVYE